MPEEKLELRTVKYLLRSTQLSHAADRRPFLYLCFAGDKILERIQYEGPPQTFWSRLVEQLAQYTLQDGSGALVVLLEATVEDVGQSEQVVVQGLIEQWRSRYRTEAEDIRDTQRSTDAHKGDARSLFEQQDQQVRTQTNVAGDLVQHITNIWGKSDDTHADKVDRQLADVADRQVESLLTGTRTTPPTLKPSKVHGPIEFDLVSIPACEFTLSKAAGGDTVAISGLRISRQLVTNKQYELFLNATGRGVPQSSRQYDPVVQISWRKANDFCEWATKELEQTIRLPSEAEWERAMVEFGAEDTHLWEWTSSSVSNMESHIIKAMKRGWPSRNWSVSDHGGDFVGFRVVVIPEGSEY